MHRIAISLILSPIAIFFTVLVFLACIYLMVKDNSAVARSNLDYWRITLIYELWGE